MGLREMGGEENWCSNNNLSLNVNKMKEIVIDFRERKGEHAPVYINGDEVERVESFMFLGVQITNNLSWSPHADTIVKKAHQRLYFLSKEIWHVSYNSHQLLQMHHRKHSFWLYHSLVWLLLCPRPQGTTKSRECSPIHHANQPPIH